MLEVRRARTGYFILDSNEIVISIQSQKPGEPPMGYAGGAQAVGEEVNAPPPAAGVPSSLSRTGAAIADFTRST